MCVSTSIFLANSALQGQKTCYFYIIMATIHGVPYFESYKIKCTMTVFTSTGKLDSAYSLISEFLFSIHFQNI